MDRDEADPKCFLGGPRGECQPGGDDNGVVADAMIAHDAVQIRRRLSYSAGYDLQAFPVMP